MLFAGKSRAFSPGRAARGQSPPYSALAEIAAACAARVISANN
jgi:hypothetical protein